MTLALLMHPALALSNATDVGTDLGVSPYDASGRTNRDRLSPLSRATSCRLRISEGNIRGSRTGSNRDGVK
jgi:hypothetical protein